MSRKKLYLLLGAVLFAVVVAVGAWLFISQDDEEEAESKTYTVGIVNITPIMNPVVDGFKERMIELGYTEGENVKYVYDGPISKDNLDATMQGLVDQKVDLILAITTPVTVKAKELTATNGIPVVFVPVTDPVAAGIVTDISRPGGNITGIISGQGETRRLEWLKTVAPDIERVFFPYNPADASPTKALEELEPVADTLGLELVTLETPDAAAVEAAIANIPDDVDAIYLPPDSLVGSLYADWVAKSIELKLPISGSSLAHVEAGVLCSYSYSPFEAGKMAARLVDRILKGTKPGDLPIETIDPTFSINMATANSMGLDISDDTLQQANIIIR